MTRAAVLLLAAVAVVAVVAGCGDDGNGGRFCDLLTESISGADYTTPAGAAAGRERLDELVAEAPREIRGDVETMQDAVRDMAGARTPEQVAAARDRLGAADFQTAILNLANYRGSYC